MARLALAPMPHAPRWAAIALLLVTALWVGALLRAPFHEDEAIYAAWSLAIVRGDPWLLTTPVDKPPLTFYPIAASVALLGRQVWAARLPALLWTLLLLAATARIAQRRGWPGWLALGLALLSPLLWAMAASAFTDAAASALALLATERALARRPSQAGAALGLALLAKPTALLLAPLVAAALLAAPPPPRSGGCARHRRGARWRSFFPALLLPLALAWAWDASRSAPSWWALGAQGYGTLGSPAAQGVAWLRVAWQALGWLTLVGALGWLFARRSAAARRWPADGWRVALALTVALWLPVHLLLGFQPWPRYLLPLAPLSALLWGERFPLRSLGLGAGGGRHAAGAAVRLVGAAPVALSFAPPPSRHRLGYPPRRVVVTGLGALLFVALIPAFATQWQIEPQGVGWRGMAEIGAQLETVPPDSVVVYRDAGRLLAWYAADSPATLHWAGAGWQALPTLAQSAAPLYLVAREGDVPPLARSWRVVAYHPPFLLLARWHCQLGDSPDSFARKFPTYVVASHR